MSIVPITKGITSPLTPTVCFSSFLWTTWGAPLNTNEAELFWFCMNLVVTLFLLSTPAQLSCCKQHFDSNLRDILQHFRDFMATRTKYRMGFPGSYCRWTTRLWVWLWINSVKKLAVHQMIGSGGGRYITEILPVRLWTWHIPGPGHCNSEQLTMNSVFL